MKILLLRSSQICLYVSQLAPGIQAFLGRSSNINPTWCWKQHEGQSSDHITYFQVSDVQLLWTSHHYFSPFIVVFRNHEFYQMLDLWNSHWTVLVETGPSKWILSSAVTFDALLEWFLDSILFIVRQSVSLGFGFLPLFLLDDDVCHTIYVCHHNLRNCCCGYT